jgi:hypothetical protein
MVIFKREVTMNDSIDPRFPINEDREPRKNKYEKFMDLVNDSDSRESLMGHAPSEFDEGLALNYHEDDFHPHIVGKIHADEELETVVKEILSNSKRLDARDITVLVDAGKVSLSGSVKTQFERDYATSLVKLVHGVGEVKSELIVKLNPGILPNDIGRNQ